MIPILYQTISEGSVPNHYGQGSLTDAIACEIKEARNGEYELTLTYAAKGLHAEDIQPNSFIKAKPNLTDSPQLFRIYKVGKTMNGQFTVNARHVSYDLSGKVITTGSAASCVAACALLDAAAGNFTINTDKTTVGAFSIVEPGSVRSFFGGKAGSLLDVYGGEWKYDNYTASLKQARGANRGVTIRYGKNLTQLSQELDMSNLVTGIVPYYIDTNGNKTVGSKVLTGLTLDVPRDVAINFSQQVNLDSSVPIATQLATLATRYINNNNLTIIKNSITLDFVQMQGLTERVDLCDTVNIYFEALGITAAAKCVETVWDVLQERYTSTKFGDTSSNIADTIATQQKELAETPSRSYMMDAINRATDLITGNVGGYVINGHDSNGDGYPDENLIMDTPDINTAVKVIRSNLGGIGLSTSGYAGPYTTAITAEGIVANAITTGTLNADLIKAGTIQDSQGNSSINMTTGEAKLKNLTAREKLVLVNSANQERGNWQFTGTECHFAIRDTNLNNVGEMWSNTNGGQIRLSNTSQKYAVSISTESDGGSLGLHHADGTSKLYLGNSIALYHTNGNTLARIIRNGYGRGELDLYNEYGSSCVSLYGDGGLGLGSGGSFTITGIGSTGVLTCVQLVQTSSRKVKENIKPIEDAAKILELDAVQFDYKNKALGINRRGFIAEDVAEILPNLVTDAGDNTPAALDYVGMIPYLQAVIKQQQAVINEHETRIAALEEKLKNIGG